MTDDNMVPPAWFYTAGIFASNIRTGSIPPNPDTIKAGDQLLMTFQQALATEMQKAVNDKLLRDLVGVTFLKLACKSFQRAGLSLDLYHILALSTWESEKSAQSGTA